MTLWIVFLALTAAAIFAVLWPLRIGAGGPAAVDGTDEHEADLAVYRDQLAEIERDRLSGLIAGSEAEAARAEVARRMLRAAESGGRAEPGSRASDRRRRIAAVVALVGVPVLAGGLYVMLGSPTLPGQPLAARLSDDPAKADIALLVRKVEAHLEANPNDGRGYEVVAPIYYRTGRLDDAVRAWQNAIRLSGSNAGRETGLGEALTARAAGVVTADAQAAFERAVKLEPEAVKANYYLGLAAVQDGRRDEAIARWSRMVAGAPADAPWLPTVKGALDKLAGGGATPAPAAKDANGAGPSTADVAAVAAMTPEQRSAMVRGMVERLAGRLAQDGSDLEGWLKLVRAWNVLGETDKAKAAAVDARRNFVGNDAALAQIDALSRELGLGS
ncbi:c-type cytochrome biogenesis protein CcmI [Ancylobacter sp. 6x-1]|uniref:C-type cytochrome biogenesis protein CcmI n=1 Tax=Ancylobacter crimeensis TaxID=2579147 RepID=A0ABT0D8Q9_9HYPH|nr:c-type cytochrome biogenesis protein CcmI [Ancylobacter crimeensis]MCK0196331.1 c-type cytochrome biogenesis protein CcmI [Ancylobacter crimeensis]